MPFYNYRELLENPHLPLPTLFNGVLPIGRNGGYLLQLRYQMRSMEYLPPNVGTSPNSQTG